MKLLIEQKIQSGFGVALGILFLIGTGAWWSAHRNLAAFQMVDHTYQVLQQLEHTLIDMLNAETGTRGFVITGDEKFLEPYSDGIAAVHRSVAELKQLTSDNPRQQRRIEELNPLLQETIDLQAELIQWRRSVDERDAHELLTTGLGKQLMDDIRKSIVELETDERQLLLQRTDQARAESRKTITIVLLSGLIATAMIGLANVIVIRDFQKRRHAEDEVKSLNTELQRHADEIAAANKELEAFSYSVSHDLRAPIRHIEGFVQLLGKRAGDNLDEKAHRYMKTIADTTKEMGQLIDDLLSFSRMGRAEMQQELVNLNHMVEKTLAGLEPQTTGRNIVWKKAPLPRAQADPAMLKQVFMNLFSNAIKYSRRRDPAEIEFGVASETENEVVVFVRDNGAGFDMQYASKLFGVFQRLHRADEFEGTGIGLANVHRIITRHGGRIWAEAAVDKGATFYFSLIKAIEQQERRTNP